MPFNIMYVAANGIRLRNKTLTLNVSESQKLKVTFDPIGTTNKKVTWVSSNTDAAVVDTYGNVTAKGEGTAIITATSQDGGYTASCTVTVKFSWWQWIIKIILFGWI